MTKGLLDSNGKETLAVDFAMVSGLIKSSESDLISQFGQSHKGVIRTLKIVEHFSRYEKDEWKNYSRIVTNTMNHIPFSLISSLKKPSPFEIKIEHPLSANYLFENLEVTFKKYDMNHDSLAEKLVNRIALDEVNRGIETTEEMLRTNSSLIGFGRVEKVIPTSESSNSSWLSSKPTQFYRLTEPENKELPYIVTSMSKPALIERLESSTKVLKVCIIIFGSIGVAIGASSLI